MIPILFEPKTKDFNTNGIGRLCEAVFCTVTEERNGEYELEMQYPVEGLLYPDIKMAALVLAEPGEGKVPQPFSIYKISKPLRGIITVNAHHISYQLSYIPCSPFAAKTAAGALNGLKQHSVEDCPYSFWTDKTNSGSFAVSVPSSIRSRLGGVEGSILDVFGGEFEFDMYTVKLHANRGKDKGVELRYGKNITDLTQEENISNTITGIYPYWSDSEGNLVELPEKILSSDKEANFPYPRTVPVDFSSKFQEKPSVSELRSAAVSYIETNHIGIPSVSIKVSFVPLWQTEEYKDLALLESVELCDVITVDYETLGVKTKAKIVRTVYDVLAGRYESLEVGDARTTLASTLAEQNQKIEEKPSKGFLDEAIKNATNWITGVNGGYVVFHKNADGQPYEILIMDTNDIETAKNVWRWNQNGWGHSKSGYHGPYTMAATIDGGIVADFITAGTMLANRISGGTLTLGGKNNGSGTFSLKNASGSEIVGMDSDGIRILAGLLRIGQLFSVDTMGRLVADSLKSKNAEITGGTININTGTFSVDVLGNVIANSLKSKHADITGGSIKINSASADESVIDLKWSYQYPNGTQYYRLVLSPRLARILTKNPDGTNYYTSLGSQGLNVGTFEGSIENPTNLKSDVFMNAGGISDGTAYSGAVTVDGRRFIISGGLIRNIQ